MKTLILILALLSIVFGNLKVLTYPKGQGISFNGDIPYSIANFGLIPYGVRATGPLYVAQPYDACTPFKLISENSDGKKQSTPFVLITRGGCTFVTKALNAAAAGAKLAIIADNDPHEDISKIVMGDDGNGDNVTIPTIFISEENGDKLKEIYSKNENLADGQQEIITLFINFDVKQTDKVDVKFFINPPSPLNYELLTHFFKNYDYVKDFTVFTPIYQFYECKDCQDQINCIRGGRYCTLDPDGDLAGNGAQMAVDYLRQICINQIYGPQLWWEYVNYQHHKCRQIPNLLECMVQKQEFAVKLNTKEFDQCMYPEYFTKERQNIDEELPILAKQERIIEKSGIYFFPSVTINNVQYKGSIHGEDVMEAVCAHSKHPSTGCKKLMEYARDDIQDKKHGGPNVALIVLIVVIVLVLFFLFMIFIYRRMVTKDLQKEMNTEVNQMVSQYIAFYESKDGKKTDRTIDEDM